MNDSHAFFILRADQYQSNPSKWFVHPPVDVPSLDYGAHSIRLIGSRGSGKTMLLRSIAEKPFGESLMGTSLEAKNRIRVYIRPDNQLMNSFKGWGISSEVWSVASQELILLRIFRELSHKINAWIKERDNNYFLKINTKSFSFDKEGHCLEDWIRTSLHNLYKWSRSPNNSPPISIATLDSLQSLLSTLPYYYSDFPESFTVSVYIDELEIYQNYQQEQINDWIKNPPLGWVFHVAHRWYLDYTRNTSSNERIEESNDYKIIDLDKPLLSSEKEGKRLRKEFYSKIIMNEVHSHRNNDEVKVSTTLLPSIKLQTVCENLRKERRALEAWKRLIKKAYKESNHKTDVNALIKEGEKINDSRWWAFWPVLIARNITLVINDTQKKANRELLANFLLGSVLQIYIETNGRVPLLAYTGFDRICSIALSNVREFMLIIKEAIENERLALGEDNDFAIISKGISPESQAKAIQNRSKNFSSFVSISAHKLGFDIQQALDNWYAYLRNVQSLSTLPYNEPNHCVLNNIAEKESAAWKTLQTAKRHGGFIFEKPTKLKQDRKDGQLDIRLHPLICVWKCLSYRKRNSPPLTFSEIKTITDAKNLEEIQLFFINKHAKKEHPNNQPDFFKEC